MSGLLIPHTPTPEPDCRSGATPVSHSSTADNSQKTDAKYTSPPPLASSDLTPPPSSQIPESTSKVVQVDSFRKIQALVASPLAAFKHGNLSYAAGLFGEIPSVDSVQDFTEEQLRSLVEELLPALGEARMSAAHAKLQHSLLSIENSESMKRAEVEHEMTRREVQVLQECAQLHGGGVGNAMSPRSPQSSTQRHLDLALKRCRELHADNAILTRRLQQAKKLIVQLDGKNTDLVETTQMLRQRIKQNRDHFNAMRSSGALSLNGTPLHKGTPKTPKGSQTALGVKSHAGSQDPFDALLFAGQVLNAETNSVPTTPSRTKPKKLHSSHVRGAHSLSSLPATPTRSRPMTADGAIFTPVNRATAESRLSLSAQSTQLPHDEEGHREDRDSTISASDNEEETFTDYDVPASQASQRATCMLRRTSKQKSDSTTRPGRSADSKGMKQGKIYGQLKKTAIESNEGPKKRGTDVNAYDGVARSNKKARTGDASSSRIGLGIATWPSPGP